MGWGCESVVAVDVVTADGSLLRADATHHSDLFWAARGAGPGFPGIVTAFHLRTYEAPVLLDDAAMQRAAHLGSNVASRPGRAFDDVRYLGPPGLCPMCHLDVVELNGSAVTCATCGSAGEWADGSIRWIDLTSPVVSMAEKRAHARVRAEIDERAARFGTFEHVVRP